MRTDVAGDFEIGTTVVGPEASRVAVARSTSRVVDTRSCYLTRAVLACAAKAGAHTTALWSPLGAGPDGRRRRWWSNDGDRRHQQQADDADDHVERRTALYRVLKHC